MVAKKPDWQQAKDYEFTESLDKFGWCWEFLRRNLSYRSEPAAMLNSFSEMYKSSSFLRSSQDIVERGPAILSREEALGEIWGMNRALDPDGDASPEFRPLYPRELDWDSVKQYYEAEDDEAPINIIADFSILAFDLTSDIDAQITVAREFLSRRCHDSNDKTVPSRKQSLWTTYLRLLDAGPDADTDEIIKHVEIYQLLSSDVYDNYKRTDRVSDHKKAARILRDDPMSILGLHVKDLPK